MKHTKGNWKLNKDNTIRGEKGQFIAQICSADNNDNEREANARLIAAAPEMLEMLVKLRTWYEDNGFILLAPNTPIVFSEAKYLIDSLNDKNSILTIK